MQGDCRSCQQEENASCMWCDSMPNMLRRSFAVHEQEQRLVITQCSSQDHTRYNLASSAGNVLSKLNGRHSQRFLFTADAKNRSRRGKQRYAGSRQFATRTTAYLQHNNSLSRKQQDNCSRCGAALRAPSAPRNSLQYSKVYPHPLNLSP